MRKVEGNGVGKEENEKDKEEEVYGGGRGGEEEEAEEEKEGEEEEEGLGKPLSAVFCSVKARSFCARYNGIAGSFSHKEYIISAIMCSISNYRRLKKLKMYST